MRRKIRRANHRAFDEHSLLAALLSFEKLPEMMRPPRRTPRSRAIELVCGKRGTKMSVTLSKQELLSSKRRGGLDKAYTRDRVTSSADPQITCPSRRRRHLPRS